MPFFLRIRHDGRAEVCETKSATLDVPSHLGKIWLNGDVICLQFSAINDVRIGDRQPLQIVDHIVSFPADEKGILAVEAVLTIRQDILKKGNEALLLAFAERGSDRSAILRLYREILS